MTGHRSDDIQKGPLFHTIRLGTGQLGDTHTTTAGQRLRDCAKSRTRGRRRHQDSQPQFRATGITAHVKNGKTLENAASMANHASTRTTQLYGRRHDDLLGFEDHPRLNFRIQRACD